MQRWSFQHTWTQAGVALASLGLFFSFPQNSRAWGRNGHRLVVNKAIDTLPPDIRAFFESNRALLAQHVTDPLDALARNYKSAVMKFGKTKLDANGLLPWQIGVYSEKLTEALKAGKWDEARLDAAILANYISEAHDPFNTTDNLDGRLSRQTGVNDRFGTALIDRYSSFFPMRPNDAMFISDPTDRAFEACLSSHSWLETILLADRKARQGENSFTDEYYDRFYNQAAAILIRQLSDAATDVGSFWLTAWINAGRPPLPR